MPVLHNVAAIRLPTCPDLPIPVTTTFPGWRWITSTARVMPSAMRSAAARIAVDSASMTAQATSTQVDVATGALSARETKPACTATAEATIASASDRARR